jgi:hypothetical protein
MNWLREDKYHMRSDDYVFTICAFRVKGELFFEAWRGSEMIATRLPSAEAAKAVCTQAEAA